MYTQCVPAVVFVLAELVLSKCIFYSHKSTIKTGHRMKANLRSRVRRKLPIIPKLYFCGFKRMLLNLHWEQRS